MAKQLVGDLQGAGANVWMDRQDIPPGGHWDREVETAINNCRKVLLVMTTSAVESDQVRDEIAYATNKKKTVIPLLFDDCDVPHQWSRLHRVDFRAYEQGLECLLQELYRDRIICDVKQTSQRNENTTLTAGYSFAIETVKADDGRERRNQECADYLSDRASRDRRASTRTTLFRSRRMAAMLVGVLTMLVTGIYIARKPTQGNKGELGLKSENGTNGNQSIQRPGWQTTVAVGLKTKESYTKDSGGEIGTGRDKRGLSNSETRATPLRIYPGRTTAQDWKNPKDGLTYLWIPPGTFQMGCSAADVECTNSEKPSHEVTITKGFWMGRTPVTQAAYEQVIGSNPSYFNRGDFPVEKVTWNEAVRYCHAVSGRLPTEAEWEYAARAGTISSRYGLIDSIAWYNDNSQGKSHTVATKDPNEWGLYDMLGNVRQWTADWYDEGYYRVSDRNNPKGPSFGEMRVLRGGAWNVDSNFARVSSRGMNYVSATFGNIGFRCIL